MLSLSQVWLLFDFAEHDLWHIIKFHRSAKVFLSPSIHCFFFIFDVFKDFCLFFVLCFSFYSLPQSHDT